MSTSSPDLKLVDSSGSSGSEGNAAGARASRETGRGSAPTWLLAVFVILSIALGIAYLSKRSEVAGLKVEAAALQAELDRTNLALSAYEGRMGEIRSGVQGLVEQAASLQALVEADPLAVDPAPASAEEAEEAEEADEATVDAAAAAFDSGASAFDEER